jgi:AraC family transcriptional regulator
MTMIPIKLADFEDPHCAPLAPELANSLVWLLDIARRNVDGDRETAKASIARASSLLQVEIDRNAAGDSKRAAPGSLAAWQVHRVQAYVDAHLEAPILIRDLAGVAQRSSAYFCRAFKRTFGETPHAFVIARRLLRANELMLTSDNSLSEIALCCGFADQAHLSKVFRSRHGQSPALWRRERRNQGCQTLMRA